MREAPPITLTEEERKKLTQLAKSRKASVWLARRAHMILRAADGESSAMIAAALGVGRVQVGRWRARYAQVGLAAITKDRPRGGRPVLVNNAHIAHLTTQTDPDGATQWSTQSLAAKAGVSDSTVLQVWRQHGLKPHLVKTFKVSREPEFVNKIEYIVGLYMSPRNMPWCSVVTRRVKCRPWTAPSQQCQARP
jgi:transposase